MAGEPTPNYMLPTYADDDAPNLTGAYNEAMVEIDAKMKEIEAGAFAPADDDAALTVQQLSEAKVTKAGIVYFKPATTKGEE